ncbi:hypothetical protein [Streptomyces europaeiscabiei]|uniref:hypothetical protein n=1 Tax=Streptomyces europaeiscabiei TaxID=146819 RepID=UPI002E125439|nr:hypothetical protein OHB30_16645 [Streptomyces europaeiscabiei]
MKDKLVKVLKSCGLNKEFGSGFTLWIFYNLIISSLPIPLAYVTLAQGGNVYTLGERGDFFIITAALLAGEMPAVSKVNKIRKGHIGDLVFALFFTQVVACIASFTITSANFSAAQRGKESESTESLPYPWFDSGTTMTVSLVLYIAGIASVIIAMAWRSKGKAGDGGA